MAYYFEISTIGGSTRRLRGRAGGCQYLFPCLLADLMKAQFGLPHVLSGLLMCVCSFSFLSALKGTFSAWWCLCSSGWWDSKSRYWCVCVWVTSNRQCRGFCPSQ